MAFTRKTDRRTCRKPDSTLSLSPKASRQSNTIVDTPRRVRLLCDAQATAGKMTRKELFKAHNIAEATGYQILKSKITRQSEHIHNQGRKSILASHKRDAIKTVENASFHFGTSTHLAIASSLGLANGSERAIQRNIADHGVGTYIAQQKKFIRQASVKKRGLWGFKRRYWHLDDFKRYRFSNECHFACALQRQTRIHRRRGKNARNAPQKIQF
jgi:hypothetical protein